MAGQESHRRAGASPSRGGCLTSAIENNPFAILGPHLHSGRLVVRTVQPHAEKVFVQIAGGDRVEMTRRQLPGIFEASLPDRDRIPDYRLHVTAPDGHTTVVDDPYRFGRVITDYDLYLFGEGNHTRIYHRLGAHVMRLGDSDGVHFGIWAPNATRVSVVGDFNAWDGRTHVMRRLGASGVWEIFVPAAARGHRYKFELRTSYGELLLKSDP